MVWHECAWFLFTKKALLVISTYDSVSLLKLPFLEFAGSFIVADFIKGMTDMKASWCWWRRLG